MVAQQKLRDEVSKRNHDHPIAWQEESKTDDISDLTVSSSSDNLPSPVAK